MYSGPPAPVPFPQQAREVRLPRRKAPWVIVVGALIALVLAPVVTVLVLMGSGDIRQGAVGELQLLKPGRHTVTLAADRSAVIYARVGATSAADGVGVSNPDDLVNAGPYCAMSGPGAGPAVEADVRTGLRVVRDGGVFDSSYRFIAPRAGAYTLSCDHAVLVDTNSSIELSSVASVGLGALAGGSIFMVAMVIVTVGIVLLVKENRRRSATVLRQFPQYR